MAEYFVGLSVAEGFDLSHNHSIESADYLSCEQAGIRSPSITNGKCSHCNSFGHLHER